MSAHTYPDERWPRLPLPARKTLHQRLAASRPDSAPAFDASATLHLPPPAKPTSARRRTRKWPALLGALALGGGALAYFQPVVARDFLRDLPSAVQSLWNETGAHPVNAGLTGGGSGGEAHLGQTRALLIEEVAKGQVLRSENATEPVLPASLAKLFVIEYVLSLADSRESVWVSGSTLKMAQPKSSKADLIPGRYSVRELSAATLIPSGCDAAWALAVFGGQKLAPQADEAGAAQAFLTGLNQHLRDKGWGATQIYEPSGFDYASRTTAADVAAVTRELLGHDWIRFLVAQGKYRMDMGDGRVYKWTNTNKFMEAGGPYFNPQVIGFKTGSLGNDYNISVLYRQGGREYLVVSLGERSDEARYQSLAPVLAALPRT